MRDHEDTRHNKSDEAGQKSADRLLRQQARLKWGGLAVAPVLIALFALVIPGYLVIPVYVLGLAMAVHLSFTSFRHYSRYRLSQRHPVLNKLLSWTCILAPFAAFVLAFMGYYWLPAAILSLGHVLVIYSEIVSPLPYERDTGGPHDGYIAGVHLATLWMAIGLALIFA